MSINSTLLDSVETELIQNNESSYKKVIPIREYSYETKKTLDLLVEKYGGFINRYDDKIIIFIQNTEPKRKQKTEHKNDDRYASIRFEKVNTSINQLNDRLSNIEERMERIMDTQKKMTDNSTDSLKSYLKYFKEPENKKEFQRLVNEILNHH